MFWRRCLKPDFRQGELAERLRRQEQIFTQIFFIDNSQAKVYIEIIKSFCGGKQEKAEKMKIKKAN